MSLGEALSTLMFALLGLALLLFPDGQTALTPLAEARCGSLVRRRSSEWSASGCGLGTLPTPSRSTHSRTPWVSARIRSRSTRSGALGWLLVTLGLVRVRPRDGSPDASRSRHRAPAAQVDRLRRVALRRRLPRDLDHLLRGALGTDHRSAADRGARDRVLHDSDRGGHRDPALPPLRHRRRDQPHAGLRCADGDAGRRVPRQRAAAPAPAAPADRRLQPGDRRLDPGGRRTVPPCACAHPGRSTAASSGASTTPPARSSAFGTRLRDEVALEEAQRRAARRRRGNDAACARLAVAEGAGDERVRRADWPL